MEVSFSHLWEKFFAWYQNEQFDFPQLDSQRNHSFRDARFCAEDQVRNEIFFRGIAEVIKKFGKKSDLSVVDAGSGTGILGRMALELGAQHCFFVEKNPYNLAMTKQLVQHFGLTSQSTFLLGDAKTIILPQQVDVIISETIVSGFTDEDFVAIVRHLQSFLAPNGVWIPSRFRLFFREFAGKKLLQTQQKEFSLVELLQTPLLTIDPATTHGEFAMDAWISEQTMLRTGACVSCLNPRLREVNQTHPVFTFVVKK